MIQTVVPDAEQHWELNLSKSFFKWNKRDKTEQTTL